MIRIPNEEGEALYDEDEDEFSGFQLTDTIAVEREVSLEDEPTVASPIPENEMTVIIDSPLKGLQQGDIVSVIIDKENMTGGILKDGVRAGNFKKPLVEKLIRERGASVREAFVYSVGDFYMVKLLF